MASVDPPGRRPGEDVNTLFRRWHVDGDARARDALTRMFLPLARKLARRYARSAVPRDDLDQVASLALVKAIDRFDTARGIGFAAFATPTILGELKRHFRDTGWFAHVPRGAQERALQIQGATEELITLHGSPPTAQQIAEHLRIDLESVLDGMHALNAYDATSLDAPQGSAEPDEDRAIGESLGAEDERFELIEQDATLAPILRTLPERNRQLIHFRFIEEMTQTEIAAQLGISQMQVSRLLRQSLDSLRAAAAASEADVRSDIRSDI